MIRLDHTFLAAGAFAMFAISPDLEKIMFSKEFWKRPEPSPKGDNSQEPIYQAVGKALSNWEEDAAIRE